jgi:hypothetical protein
MQKKVENVVAAAMLLIRKPSEQALPLEDRRLLLHNILERYTQQALRANEDFATHELACALAYSANLLAFDVTIPGMTNETEFDPVGIETLKLKLNITEEAAANHRWRLAFRYFPEEPADWGDTVAFPPRFTQLLEYALAKEALPLVLDDTPSFASFRRERMESLTMDIMKLEAQYAEYLQRPINARLVTSPAYHYRTNNLFRSRGREVRVERIS